MAEKQTGGSMPSDIKRMIFDLFGLNKPESDKPG